MERLTSRKFLLTVAGCFIVLLKGLGVIAIEDDNLWQLLAAVLGFVGVEGAADIVGRWKQTDF